MVNHYRILTGAIFAWRDKDLQGSTDMWEPSCASHLRWFQNIYTQLSPDTLKLAHALWAKVICFPDELENVIDGAD